MHAPVLFRNRAVGGGIACAGFLFLGWGTLVVPSLVRPIEAGFGQTDAALGLFYLVMALTWAAGSLVGGPLAERFGLRSVLVVSIVVGGIGMLLQGAIPSWTAFVLLAIPRGLGAGGLEGGLSALVLDLYPDARGRALNVAHLFFALSAFVAPIALGTLLTAGVPWQALVAAGGAVSLAIVVPLLVTDIAPHHHAVEAARTADRSGRLWLAAPILALGAAIGLYVASEAGVSNWLVRFLASASLTTATTALGLFWGGLMIGRLASARFGDRFDPLGFAMTASLVGAVALAVAIVMPILGLQVLLFGIVGIAYGPIYPLIVAAAGARYPGRTASVSGILTAAGVLGSVVYPPLMGVMSVTVGLPLAMAGTVVIVAACAGAVFLAGRMPPAADVPRSIVA